MNICIGIISYLPSNEKRQKRIERLSNVLNKCSELFNLPIIIVAQNWKSYLPKCNSKLIIYSYKRPLGINQARIKLREIFLNSEYDYLIMLDDDSKLSGSVSDAQKYIEDINNNPGKWGAYKPMLLKLFAISKEVFSQVEYRDGKVENGDFFEDMLLIKTLEKKFSNKKFNFRHTSLREDSDSAHDPLSTWYYGQYVKKEIGDRTRKIIGEL